MSPWCGKTRAESVGHLTVGDGGHCLSQFPGPSASIVIACGRNGGHGCTSPVFPEQATTLVSGGHPQSEITSHFFSQTRLPHWWSLGAGNGLDLASPCFPDPAAGDVLVVMVEVTGPQPVLGLIVRSPHACLRICRWISFLADFRMQQKWLNFSQIRTLIVKSNHRLSNILGISADAT